MQTKKATEKTPRKPRTCAVPGRLQPQFGARLEKAQLHPHALLARVFAFDCHFEDHRRTFEDHRRAFKSCANPMLIMANAVFLVRSHRSS